MKSVHAILKPFKRTDTHRQTATQTDTPYQKLHPLLLVLQVLECHVFICESAEAGIALVQATSYAFEHREGWLSDGSPPPAPIGSSMMFGGSVSQSLVAYFTTYFYSPISAIVSGVE